MSPVKAGVYVTVVSAAAVAAIAMGLRQALGLYLAPVSEHLGTGREAFGFSIAVANLIWGLAAPFIGYVADRFGAARVIIFGGLTTIAGFALLFAAEDETQLLLSGVLMGLGVSGAGISALVGIAARSVPDEMRTEAISWVGIGSGLGMLAALPYSYMLMEWLGWQQSLLWLAATAVLILPLALALKTPRASVPIDDAPVPEPVSGILASALQSSSYWLLMTGFFVCGFHVVFYATHLPAFVSDAGLPAWVSVAALTLVGLGNLVGNYLAGYWGRNRPLRYGLAGIYFGRALVFLGFLFLPTTAFNVLVLSALLGVLWLSTVPLTSGLVSVMFGARWLTMLYGVVFLSHQLGSFAGVWLAGALYDRLKSYTAMWWICVGLGVMAALLHVPIRERRLTADDADAALVAR